jgi:hypothetical protein
MDVGLAYNTHEYYLRCRGARRWITETNALADANDAPRAGEVW